MNSKLMQVGAQFFWRLCFAGLPALAFGAPLTGQWAPQTGVDTPAFAHHDMVYDAASNRLVVVGADMTMWPRTNYWVYYANTNLEWQAGPIFYNAGTGDPELAYDPDRQVTVLYTVNSNAVWELHGDNWVRVECATIPVQCLDGALFQYDPVRKRSVLVGSHGYPGTNVTCETWFWDGTNWTLAADTNQTPVGAAGGGMAFDAARGEMVLVTMTTMETWTFNGAVWTKETPATTPQPGVWVFNMEYEPQHQQVVLYGGEGGSWPATAYPSNTWLWGGGDWALAQTTNSPGGLIDYGFTWFPPRQGLLIYGGWCDPGWAPRTNIWLLTLGGGAPELQVGGLMIQGNDFRVQSFGGDASATQILQRCAGFAAPVVWQDVATNQSPQPTNLWLYPLGAEAQNYFRVEER